LTNNKKTIVFIFARQNRPYNCDVSFTGDQQLSFLISNLDENGIEKKGILLSNLLNRLINFFKVRNEYQKRMDILNDEIDDLSRELDEYKKNELLMQRVEEDQKQRIEVLENELYSKSRKISLLKGLTMIFRIKKKKIGGV
jgi:hypothetical protein